MDAKKQLMENILCDMQANLTKEQIYMLERTLLNNMHDVVVESIPTELSLNVDDNDKYLKLFVASRRLEGMSDRTIRSYYFYTKKFLTAIDKNFRDISTTDVQWYLANYEVQHPVSRRSLDNIRKGINGWFLWLEENQYIDSNPVKRVHPIAYEKKPVVILSEDDIVLIREYLHGKVRERALVEFLLSTGVRVSELCNVDIDDCDLDSGEVIIHCAKKRNKQDRVCFLTPAAVFYIRKYMKFRQDNNYMSSPALFQSNKTNGLRITERIVNTTLRNIENELNLEKPLTVHIFRKTVATILHKRGMNHMDIATYLGHVDTSTSEQYYIGVQKDDLKREFIKYR